MNSKISALTSATTPLAGTETLPIVQSGATKQVSVANLTAGRSVSVANLTNSALTSGRITYATTGGLLTDNSGWTYGIDNVKLTYSGPTSYIATNSTASNNFLFTAGASNCQLSSPNGYDIVLITAGSTKLTVSNSSDVTVNLGNIVQGTAAKGVNFTANTPAAGMTSQLLNWYEEGTWTPADASGAGLTFTSVTAKYTRIGRQVTATAVFTFPTTASAVQSQISGLPFAASNMGQFLGIKTGVAGASAGLVSAAGTTIVLYTQAGGNQTNAANTTATIYLTGTYFV